MAFEACVGRVEGTHINPPRLSGSGSTTQTGKKAVFAQYLDGIDGELQLIGSLRNIQQWRQGSREVLSLFQIGDNRPVAACRDSSISVKFAFGDQPF
ncbi:hypothetical protein D3C73_1156120 [compost metagenome]